MAVTKLIAVGNKKGGIGKTLDYICNPDKTAGGEFVSGFNCSPETAANEFDITKIKFDKVVGRQGYHLIQSFAPEDNVTLEQANQIGRSLAKELLNGEFEFVVSTHCDKLHKHNHIVFNSVSFIDGKKFHGGADIFHRIQRISDKLCRENGLSIIAKKKERGKSYAEYRADKQGKSWKTKLRETIDHCILKSRDWEEFLVLMKKENYEVKRGKYISFRANEQSRFTRAKTLGERYTEEIIKRRIFARESKENKYNTPLIIDIDNNVKIQQSAGYKHWAEMRNLKIAAAAINYLVDNNLMNYEALSEKCGELETKRDSTLSRIKEVESRIKFLKPQIKDIDTFRKNKPVVEKINSVVFKEKYRREHEREFILFEAAKKSLKSHFPDGKYPLIKTLRAELNLLYSEKEKLYSEYNFAKEEYKNILANKSVVDFILNNPHEKEPHSRGRNGYELE